MTYEFYPSLDKEDKNPYYAEFHHWAKDNITFTIFRRQFFCSKEQRLGDTLILGSWEFHPWNLFEGSCNDGCVPDREWIKWLVDALNEKSEREKSDIKNGQ